MNILYDLFEEFFPLVQKTFVDDSDEGVDKVFLEFIKFAIIASNMPRIFFPCSPSVDKIWHLFILETRPYRRFCNQISSGWFLHHSSIPFRDYSINLSQEDLLNEDLSVLCSYIALFGDFQESIVGLWPVAKYLIDKKDMSVKQLNEFLRETISRSNLVKSDKLFSERNVFFNSISKTNSEKEIFIYDKLKNSDLLNSYQAIASKVAKYSKVNTNKQVSILDLGSGSGKILEDLELELDFFSYLGVDISESAIKFAEKRFRNRYRFQYGDVQYFDFGNETFDVAIFHMVAALLKDAKSVIDKLFFLLNPGGHIYILTPAYWRYNDSDRTRNFKRLASLLDNYKNKLNSIGIGDGRFWSREGIFECIDSSKYVLEEEDFDLEISLSPILALLIFTEELYQFHVASDSEKKLIVNSIFEELLLLKDSDTGKVRLTRPMQIFTLKKK